MLRNEKNTRQPLRPMAARSSTSVFLHSPLVGQVLQPHAERELSPPQAPVALHPQHVVLLRPAPTPPAAARPGVRLASLQPAPRARIPPPAPLVRRVGRLRRSASSGADTAASNTGAAAPASTPGPASHDEGPAARGAVGRRGRDRGAVLGLLAACGWVPGAHVAVPDMRGNRQQRGRGHTQTRASL